jgi:hypothetical protein
MSKFEVDTCIFGPSVRADRISEFINQLKLLEKPSECALIAARHRTSEEEVSGVHAALEYPCSQSTFNVELASALTNSHKGTLPQSKTRDPHSGQSICLKTALSKLEYPPDESIDTVAKRSRAPMWPRETLEAVLTSIPQLQAQLDDLQPSHLGFRMDGTPTEFTSEVVMNLVKDLFPQSATTRGLSEFKFVLEDLIYKWAQISTQRGRRLADICLRQEIANCFQVGRTQTRSRVSSESRPATPPLSTCLIIDFRLTSRERLKSLIESTNLFETIVFPDTSPAALEIFAKSSIDLCVFGPSVSIEKIRDLQEKVYRLAHTRDCGLMGFSSKTSYNLEETLHSALEYPCSQESLNLGIVSALARSHGGTLPIAKRYDEQTKDPILLRNCLERLRYPSGESVESVLRRNRSMMWPKELLEAVLGKWEVLQARLDTVNLGHLSMLLDSLPPEEAFASLRDVAQEVFPQAEHVRGMAAFRRVLEELIYAWANLSLRRSRETANASLKREVFNCFRLNMQ